VVTFAVPLMAVPEAERTAQDGDTQQEELRRPA
jgi:hypothetical protein